MQQAELPRLRLKPPASARTALRRSLLSPFETEAALVEMIRGLFAQNASERWTWISELVSPSGIADLAAVRLVPGWRNMDELHRLPPRWLYALKSLPVEPFRVEDLANLANVTPSAARGVLKSYADCGFCVYRAEQGTWIKQRDPSPVAERIIAIEAKLSDWRRALYQASRYLDYANQSWVVLDSKAFANARLHVDEFQHRGIGLAGVSPTGEFEVACTAAFRTPRLPQRFWQVNAKISRHLAISRLQMAPVEAV